MKKINWRRILALCLAVSCLLAVTACGDNGGTQGDANANQEADADASKPENEDEKEEEKAPAPINVGVDATKMDMSYPVRVIVTTDGECDDNNSLRHMLLYANDLDIAGLVYSSSQFHWQGDGEHTISEVIEDYMCASEIIDVETALEYRPQEIGWIEDVITNEYGTDYKFLVQNDPNYPSPEELLSVVKVGNVQFEADVREASEGSDWIKDCMLDDDPRPLYVQSWGGFNTVARALLSIHEEYGETAEWEEIYQKVCSKVVIQGHGQDKTYDNYIKDLYPDLMIYMGNSNGYGYNASENASEQARHMFQAEWLKENIKFDHGAMMSNYRLMNDGIHYEGEPELYQFGERTTIDWSGNGNGKQLNDYDWIGEGDSIHWIPLIPVGLRGLENGNYGTWGGRFSVNGQVLSSKGDYKEYDYVTGQMNEFGAKRWLEALQHDWAARSDWAVGTYEQCNHAPVVSATALDITAKKGEVVSLEGAATDPDGDVMDINWWVYEEASEYSGKYTGLEVWYPNKLTTKFTVPQDAKPGDYFNVILEVTDRADAPMTRYAQVIVTVTE